MKKILCFILGVLVFASLMVACKGQKVQGDNQVYYVKADKTGIEEVAVELKASSLNGQIKELLEDLALSPEDVEYMSTIPTEVEVDDFELENKGLTLYLTGPYYSLDVYTQVLVRAAIVKTLTQLDGVDSVAIYVEDEPLTDANGMAIGSMTSDMFIDDFGQETDSLLSKELTLYFASADGMSLTSEKRVVYYSRNVSLERLVIEELMDGPSSDQLVEAIPTGTKLISISNSDGICYVNFDSGLETTISGVTENATIYSIVDSLTALESVKQVQLLVNGETPHISNIDIDLSAPVSANKDIIHQKNTASDEEEIEASEDTDEIVVDLSEQDSDKEDNSN